MKPGMTQRIGEAEILKEQGKRGPARHQVPVFGVEAVVVFCPITVAGREVGRLVKGWGFFRRGRYCQDSVQRCQEKCDDCRKPRSGNGGLVCPTLILATGCD